MYDIDIDRYVYIYRQNKSIIAIAYFSQFGIIKKHFIN